MIIDRKQQRQRPAMRYSRRSVRYCRVVAAETVRDGITANCIFTFEVLCGHDMPAGERFDVIYPLHDKPGPPHLLLMAIGLRHILRVDVSDDGDELTRYQPRFSDLMPILQRHPALGARD